MPFTAAHRLTLGLALATSLLSACANFPGSTTAAQSSKDTKSTAAPAAPTYQPVSDVPIPAGTKINTERSVILGSGDRWFGRMVLVLDRATTQTFAYYQEQMPTFGWELVTAVQGKSSSLTFTRGERAATVEITSGGLRGSEVSVTVSPRQPPAAPKKP